MKKISKYIIKYWYAYLVAMLAMIASVALDILSPFITKHIIDDVIIGEQSHLLTKFLLMILLIGIGRATLKYIKEIIFDLTSSKVATSFRRTLFLHIEGLSMSFFSKNNTGELLSRLREDVDTLWNALGYVVMLIVEISIHSAIIIYCMFNLNAKLTIIPLLVMPLMALTAIIMQKQLGKIYGEISEENAKLNTVASENLAGARVVKAYAREKYEINKFLSHNKRFYDLNMQQSKVFVKIFPIFQFASKVIPLVIIIVGGNDVIKGRMTLGDLGAFTQFSMNIIWPMEMLGWLTNDLSSAIASNKKIKKIFANESEIIDPKEALVLDKVKGQVKFDKVNFSIDDKQVLTDISFDLAPGKTLGIMGPTGSGKSTIVNLLQRFYNVSDGQISIDGVNINKLSLQQVRTNISVVMQDVFLFSTSIKDNIKFGNSFKLDKKQVIKAADITSASQFISSMKQEYDTIIGEKGVGLSGGQKQRISMARTISKRAPILIFDDSTSALDMETEFSIQRELNKISATKIIIAHRISAVKNADEIIIIDDGKIIERGTHKSLMDNKGYYYETFISQYGNIEGEVF